MKGERNEPQRSSRGKKSMFNFSDFLKGKKEKRDEYTANDIGAPFDIIHEMHVSYDTHNNPFVKGLPDDMLKMLETQIRYVRYYITKVIVVLLENFRVTFRFHKVPNILKPGYVECSALRKLFKDIICF